MLLRERRQRIRLLGYMRRMWPCIRNGGILSMANRENRNALLLDQIEKAKVELRDRNRRLADSHFNLMNARIHLRNSEINQMRAEELVAHLNRVLGMRLDVASVTIVPIIKECNHHE